MVRGCNHEQLKHWMPTCIGKQSHLPNLFASTVCEGEVQKAVGEQQIRDSLE